MRAIPTTVTLFRLNLSATPRCVLLSLPCLGWREHEFSLKTRLIDYGDDKTGHIDFSDARCVTFDAEINLEFVGGKVILEGFKVDDDDL